MLIQWLQELKANTCGKSWVVLAGNEADLMNATLPETIKTSLTLFSQHEPKCFDFGKRSVLYVTLDQAISSVMIVGIGSKPINIEKLRLLGGQIRKQLQKGQYEDPLILIPPSWQTYEEAACQAFVEGLLLGGYEFNAYKTEMGTKFDLKHCQIYWHGLSLAIAAKIVDKAQIIADSVALARDLVNTPANDLTPTHMAQQARQVQQDTGLEVVVLSAKEIERLGMRTFLAVAKGSNEPPQFIVCRYQGNPADSHWLSYVGKGITFDSGGISLKPSLGMGEMKDDMAGAAAVLAAMRAIALLKPSINVMGIIPCTENMPSGHAYRPGDIIRSMSGKTVEIITTDAEGRLILADALTYAKQQGATRLVDVATLTGACVVALGKVASGVFANNQPWAGQVLAAAEQCGEKMWQFPLYEEYSEQIKSDFADLKNSGGREAGAITAGAFLQAFVEDTPWVHIDIAGTVQAAKETGPVSKGATGVAVRTLIALAEGLS